MLGLGLSFAAPAAFAAAPATTDANPGNLEEVVVTGSLIPQVRVETSTPITVISADDIQNKGFTTVADALQRSSFATGSIQGPQFSIGFTPGAQTLSLFGLSPSYTKYLIDGRPIADYPALYNGTDIIASISGIPTILVDHIDILPGGQSSIYGSDAIAGVVNIILKKKLSGPEADFRYGFTQDGGATDRRLSLADGFSIGGINVLVGGQYDKLDPIWGFQRKLTSQYFNQGTSPQTAERDYLVFGLFGDANGQNTYYFEDPANCANVAGLFGHSVQLHSRPNLGSYCGTTNAGYYTIGNGVESTQGYLHLDDNLTDQVQLFSDVLVNHDVQRFASGTGLFDTAADPTSPFYYYEDPNINDLLNVQHFFSPEETGGLNNTLAKDTNNSIRATVGVKGGLGASHWTYDADMTYTENRLTEQALIQLTSAINAFYAPVFGPKLGFDPVQVSNIFAPNYAAFYMPITPSQYFSFSTRANNYSRTEDSLARGQLTNSSLFRLPGGDAGLALVAEGGAQGWDYQPDPRFLNGDAYLFTSTAGSGHRSRYAGTAELRLPIVKMLTLDASGRYDDYHVAGGNVNKATYNIGVEFRPLESLLIRGRYGTAFKAPTLSDEFQGQSGFFETLTDYYTCFKNGFTPATLGNCPQAQASYFGLTQGNPKLQPITAKVADVGIVWKPLDHFSFAVDYLHWSISNEVAAQNADQLLRIEANCRLGLLDINSPTCVQALAQVNRDANGVLVSVLTPKQNVAQEIVNALDITLSYGVDAGRAGVFVFDGQYTDLLKHQFTQFPGDTPDNLLEDPILSTDFKTKENVSVTWNLADFSSTFYVEHYGRTPNYLATINGYGTPGAGRLGTWTIANFSVRYQILKGLQVSGTVDNLFNRQPPIDHSYPGTQNQPYNFLNYNVYGRSFFLEASYRVH